MSLFKEWRILVAFAAVATFVLVPTSGAAPADHVTPGSWGGPTAQGQRIDFTVNNGTPQTVDPISYGAVLNCPSGRSFSVGHGFFGFQTPIDANHVFLLEFGPDQGSLFTYSKVQGTFTSADTAEGYLVEKWAVLVNKKKSEVCTSRMVDWTATPGGLTDASYDHYFKHTMGKDGKITTEQVK